MTKIGIFDSGIGGLSILREIHQLDRALDIYYIADTKNNPYGNKDRDFIISRSIEIVSLLKQSGCTLIVVACNTATAWAIESLRDKFPELAFVGVEPYINVINHREDLKDKRGVVFATPLTGDSARFKKLKSRLDPDSRLDVYLPKGLAATIEENFFLSHELLEKKVLNEIKSYPHEYDFYILGCTHYPLVSKTLEKSFEALMISPCSMVAQRVNKLVDHSSDVSAEGFSKQNTFQYLQTDKENQWKALEYNQIF